MRPLYPYFLDHFPGTIDRRQKYASSTSPRVEPEDIVFILRELQKLVGTKTEELPSSHEYRIAAIEGLLAELVGSGFQVGAAASSAVTTGGVTISYGKIITPAPIGIKTISCKNASLEDIGIEITNITTTGFDAASYPDNGTLVWETVQAH